MKQQQTWRLNTSHSCTPTENVQIHQRPPADGLTIAGWNIFQQTTLLPLWRLNLCPDGNIWNPTCVRVQNNSPCLWEDPHRFIQVLKVIEVSTSNLGAQLDKIGLKDLVAFPHCGPAQYLLWPFKSWAEIQYSICLFGAEPHVVTSPLRVDAHGWWI